MKKIFLSLTLFFGGVSAFCQTNTVVSDTVIHEKITNMKQRLTKFSSGERVFTACTVDAVLMEGLRDSYRDIMAMYDTLQTLAERIILGELSPTAIEEFSGEDFKTVFYFSSIAGAEMWITLDAAGTMISSKMKTKEIKIMNGDLYVNRTGVTVYQEEAKSDYVFLCPITDLLGLIYQCGDGYLIMDIRRPDADRTSFWSKAFRVEDMTEIPLSTGESWIDFK